MFILISFLMFNNICSDYLLLVMLHIKANLMRNCHGHIMMIEIKIYLKKFAINYVFYNICKSIKYILLFLYYV